MRQGGKGGNYTPKQARDLLSAPVYAVLAQQAVPIFPGTSLAAPSGLVGIFRLPGTHCRHQPNGVTVVLPVWLNGRQWERAVVPVLRDPRWSNQGLIFQWVQNNNLPLLIGFIGEALALSFHEAGYGPLPS